MTLLARVAAALREAGVAHALIGAGALAVYGVNRSAAPGGDGREDRSAMVDEVDKHLPDLPPHATKLWNRVIEG